MTMYLTTLIVKTRTNRKSKFYPSMIDSLDSVWERNLSGIYSQMVIAEKLL